VSRKVHTDAEKKPPAQALRALQEWLDANGLRRSGLVEPLGVRQAQILRLFAGAA
jgi:predicted xylose isomerase-like sugar epimerase